jgi:hypothetical protein
VSLDGVKLGEQWPVLGDRGARRFRRPGLWQRFRYWRLRWLVLVTVPILAAAASVLLTLASGYRPLAYGEDDMRNLSYPGLPAGHGIRSVNSFGGIRTDHYIPPQRGTFYLVVSVTNLGSRSVTVEKAFMPHSSALRSAGRALYSRPGADHRAIGDPRPSRVLHDVKLGPGDEIFVAIPVRSGRCAERDSWMSVPFFYVKYRFLFFHHIAALPWGMHNDMLIMHAPFGKPGRGGVFCAR